MTMKLSEAIILGDTLKRADPSVWLNHDGSCGCAFGGAVLAAGCGGAFYNECRVPHESQAVLKHWPWLEVEHVNAISQMYWEVFQGTRTIESVSAYVKSIEPANDGGRASKEGERGSKPASDSALTSRLAGVNV